MYTDGQLIDYIQHLVDSGDEKDILINEIKSKKFKNSYFIYITYTYTYDGGTHEEHNVFYIENVDKYILKQRKDKINKLKECLVSVNLK